MPKLQRQHRGAAKDCLFHVVLPLVARSGADRNPPSTETCRNQIQSALDAPAFRIRAACQTDCPKSRQLQQAVCCRSHCGSAAWNAFDAARRVWLSSTSDLKRFECRLAMNLKELSARLGLSQTTVSRALNGYPEVSEATRRRVEAAARRVRLPAQSRRPHAGHRAHHGDRPCDPAGRPARDGQPGLRRFHRRRRRGLCPRAAMTCA